MLQKALQFIRERGYNVYSVCEWKDGNEQKEELQPANHANNCYSLSKSFTSAAIGMLEYAGKLSRGDKIGQYIGDLFPAGNADKLQKSDGARPSIARGGVCRGSSVRGRPL